MPLLYTNCKKLVEVSPPVTNVTGASVFTTDATAISALTGIYASISSVSLLGTSGSAAGVGLASLSLYPGLSADELRIRPAETNSTYKRYYQNALSTTPALSFDFWTKFYPVIYSANAAIVDLGKSTGLTPSVKAQLLGEAKFIRAFCYFYLVNLYGDAPLITGKDFEENANTARNSKAAIYDLIKNDLKEAKESLSPDFLDGSLVKYSANAERVRPTRWAATSLLARVYLYLGLWADAETQATEVINNNSTFSLVPISSAFLKNNNEAIWQLQPVTTGWNTWEARMFVLPSTGPNTSQYPFYLNSLLVNSFEANDQRKTSWIRSVTVSGTTYYYPYKYKSATLNAPVTEYSTVIRLAEQYLIRAEARAQQGNLGGAISDIDVIRQRAGLPLIANTNPGISQSALLAAILHEKQVELFTEWGHRWLDLKRSGTIDAVMSTVTPLKGGTWEATDQLYPISLIELQRNPLLIQNPGY
jgi:hypothetical protein